MFSNYVKLFQLDFITNKEDFSFERGIALLDIKVNVNTMYLFN